MNEKYINAKFGTLEIPLFGLSQVENDGSIDGLCSTSGAMGKLGPGLIIQSWLNYGHNCTLTGYPIYGDYSNGTGMKGSIATKETDILLMPTRIHEYESVDYEIPLWSDDLIIACAYNYTGEPMPIDLLDAYLTFHWSYYFSVLFAICYLVAAWSLCAFFARKLSRKVRKEIRRARIDSCWIVFSAIIDQDNFPVISSICFTILSLCSSIIFFVLIDCFMLNMISTDLVVIDEPKVIKSYYDIARRKDLGIVFLPGMNEEDFFKDAKYGTYEYEIWRKRQQLESVSPGSIGQMIIPAINQKLITILREWIQVIASNYILQVAFRMEEFKDARILLTRDTTEKYYTSSFIVSKDVHPILKRFIHNISLKVTESGIMRRGTSYEYFRQSDEFMDPYYSYQLDLPDMPMPYVKLRNLRNLFILSAIFMILVATVLLFEKIKHMKAVYNVENTHKKAWSVTDALRT